MEGSCLCISNEGHLYEGNKTTFYKLYPVYLSLYIWVQNIYWLYGIVMGFMYFNSYYINISLLVSIKISKYGSARLGIILNTKFGYTITNEVYKAFKTFLLE